jgi:lysophospholipase L1-like esterase
VRRIALSPSRLPDDAVALARADPAPATPLPRRAGIVRSNAILNELAADRGAALVDSFDGLHPSGLEYALWVERIAAVVRRLLDRR